MHISLTENMKLPSGLWYVVGINSFSKMFIEGVYSLTKEMRRSHFINGFNGFHLGKEIEHHWYSFVSTQKEPDRFTIIEALYHKDFLQRNYPFHGTKWKLTKSFYKK